MIKYFRLLVAWDSYLMREIYMGRSAESSATPGSNSFIPVKVLEGKMVPEKGIEPAGPAFPREGVFFITFPS